MRKYRKRWRRRIRTIDCWNLSKTIRKISWNILAMKTVLVAHLLLRLFFFFFFSGAHINLRIRFRSKWVELRNLHVIVSGRLFPDYFHPLLCPIIMDERQYVRLAKAFIVLTRFLNVIASFVFGDKSFVLRDFLSFTTIIHSRSYVLLFQIPSPTIRILKRQRVVGTWNVKERERTLHWKKSEFIYDFNYHGDYGNILPEHK